MLSLAFCFLGRRTSGCWLDLNPSPVRNVWPSSSGGRGYEPKSKFVIVFREQSLPYLVRSRSHVYTFVHNDSGILSISECRGHSETASDASRGTSAVPKCPRSNCTPHEPFV